MSFGITSGLGKSFRVGNRPQTVTSASQLPNLEIWYDASTATYLNTGAITNGAEVSSWQNGGGLSSHDWNSTGGKRPEWFSNVKNGKGAVRFNATSGDDNDTDEYLSINPIAYLQSLAGCTMFLVFKTLTTAAGRRILTSSNTSGYQWGQNGTQWVGTVAGGAFTVDALTADTNYHHVTMKFDGSQTGNANRLKVRFDGSDANLTFSSNVNATTSASASALYGGVDATGNSGYWNGELAEFMLFTRTLTNGEMLAIEDYISNKWAI
jgi:hypothetical protein